MPVRLVIAAITALTFIFAASGAAQSGCGVSICVGDSWDAAIRVAAQGDVLIAQAGIHPPQSISYQATKGGREDEADVVIRGEPGAVVQGITLYGARHLTFESLDVQGGFIAECEDSGVPTEARGQHPVDVTLRDSHASTVRSENAHLFTVAKNEIGPSSTVIKVGASADTGGANCTDEPPSDIAFRGNDIHNFRESSAASHMECVFVEGVQGFVFEGNITRGCSVFDIFFKQQLAAGLFGMKRILVENNFLGHPVASAFRSAGTRAISFSVGNYEDLNVRGNSLNARLELRTDLATIWTRVVVEDNLAESRGGSCTAGITWQRNAYLAGGQSCLDDLASGVASGWIDVETAEEINSSTSDPTIDYHLSSGAWAIDRSSAGPAQDFDSQSRPLGVAFDVGADEFGVLDTTAPVLLLPADIMVQAPDLLGALVAYSVSASDDLDPAPSVSCAPPSGSLFPVGMSQVLCEARDASGNASQGTFLVSVLAPVDDPPSDPGDLSVSAYTQRTVTIVWPGATDDVGIAEYRLYMDGTFLATAGPNARQAKFSVTWGQHAITVEAVDTVGQRTPGAIVVKGIWQEQ